MANPHTTDRVKYNLITMNIITSLFTTVQSYETPFYGSEEKKRRIFSTVRKPTKHHYGPKK